MEERVRCGGREGDVEERVRCGGEGEMWRRGGDVGRGYEYHTLHFTSLHFLLSQVSAATGT